MKKLLLISFTLLFSTELEVDGNLKVTGEIDAQNNAIKNVGIPTTMTDAINGNVLQSALRDDSNYEYKMYMIKIPVSDHDYTSVSYHSYGEMSENTWNVNFHDEFLSLVTNGWILSNTTSFTEYSGKAKALYIFKRLIEE